MADKDTLYARWLDGDLSAEEIKQLKASGEWDELESLVKATSEISLPAYDKESIYAKLLADKKSKSIADQPVGPVITMNTILSAAASLALLLGAIFFLREAAPKATAAYGETLVHTLIDNSMVVLNDGSSIAYDEETWNENRTVKLTGEALFEVENGSAFIVETSNGTVEVLGTSFNVRAWDDNYQVECYHGRVKVSYKGKSVDLTRNQSVGIEDLVLGSIQTIDNDKPYWRTGISKFKNENLGKVFSELERQYDITIDRPTFTRKFNGSFTHDNLKTALEQITKPMGLSFNNNDQNTHVIITN